MRFAIMGAGGIGGYFGGRLAAAGQDVTFIARGAHLRALQKDGLHIEQLDGRTLTVSPAVATDDPSRVGQVETVIVAVKAWQVPDAARAIQPMVGPDTLVLPLQNGVEASDQLAAVLGAGHVLGGLCHIMAFVTAPGHIRHGGIDPVITMGELDNRVTPRIRRLQEALQQAGIRAVVPEDIHAALWTKFMFIAALSGVGAVTRVPVGLMRGCAGSRAMLQQAMQEIQAVAAARGIALAGDVVGTTMGFIDKLPPAGTASMQRDIIEGRPSELDSQNGAVVRLGEAAGVDVPVNRFLYASLQPLEAIARGELQRP